MDHTHAPSRLVSFIVIATFGYIITEAAVKTLMEQRATFVTWRAAFVERFNRNPGHVEFLRETLVAEEMNVKRAAHVMASDDADCGCD